MGLTIFKIREDEIVSKYDEMSDIVIDRKIFSLMFGDGDKDMERIWKENKFRPCSQPNVAWSIIVENEISLIRDVSTNDVWEAVAKLWYTCEGAESSLGIEFEVIDKNPLRAAMICFLKMKDAE